MRELRNTQEQLMMKEKMAALGDLVAGLAHEINNPIGAMNSSADVCARCIRKIEHTINQSKSISKDSGEALASSLTTLRNNIDVTLMAGDRIATIVKSLRNFARLDEAEYQRADIREGIDSSLTLLESEFQERISVIKEYHDIPKIPCYPGQLNQVFMSLLRNASQSITDSGTIKIRMFTQNGDVHVEFSDNGKGIPANRLKRLFDFGFSEEGSRVKMTSGLSTAYHIIQKHNGEIRVTSKVGKGSTFLVILPVKESQK
ncbi:hypothetical protein GWO43_07020 [candidate division KSB1 bacterium]|nr:hypothetical protein [candidate division KSB1 bacterium]NIS23715.1 hypothetical protein [candidate division KSB1 bacterium]NIT70635.1 hypothetical protein [candidate division KSB1 bacterium]NIU24363.1 hypothetical protein [candidate division KSB1 bacterium]NIU94056.1 hypothetical protein [candidate division KSB1 bacterium]